MIRTTSCWTNLIFIYSHAASRDSAVGIVTGCWLDDQGVGVRVLVGAKIFISPCRPDRLWGLPSLLSNGYRGLFLEGKAAGVWNWTPTFQLMPRPRKRGSIHPLPHTSSRCSASLFKHRDNFTAGKQSVCFRLASCLDYFSTLKMEATCSSEMSVEFRRTTWYYTTEEKTLHKYRCENLESCTEPYVCRLGYESLSLVSATRVQHKTVQRNDDLCLH
jgi:hypothetical protein